MIMLWSHTILLRIGEASLCSRLHSPVGAKNKSNALIHSPPTIQSVSPHKGMPLVHSDPLLSFSPPSCSCMTVGPPSDAVRLLPCGGTLSTAGTSRTMSSRSHPATWKTEIPFQQPLVMHEEGELSECSVEENCKNEESYITPSASFEMEELEHWVATFEKLSTSKLKSPCTFSHNSSLLEDSVRQNGNECSRGLCKSKHSEMHSEDRRKDNSRMIRSFRANEQHCSTERREVPRPIVYGDLGIPHLSFLDPPSCSSSSISGTASPANHGNHMHSKEDWIRHLEEEVTPSQIPPNTPSLLTYSKKQNLVSYMSSSLDSMKTAAKEGGNIKRESCASSNYLERSSTASEPALLENSGTPLVCSSLSSLPSPSLEPSHFLFPHSSTLNPSTLSASDSTAENSCARRTALHPSAVASSPHREANVLRFSPDMASPIGPGEESYHSKNEVECTAVSKNSDRKVKRVVKRENTLGNRLRDAADTSPPQTSPLPVLETDKNILSSSPSLGSSSNEMEICSFSLQHTLFPSSLPSIPKPDPLLCGPRWKKKESSNRCTEVSLSYFDTAISYYQLLHSSLGSSTFSIPPCMHHENLSGILSQDCQTLNSAQCTIPTPSEKRCRACNATEYPYLFLLFSAYGAIANIHSDGLLFLLEYSAIASVRTKIAHSEGKKGETKLGEAGNSQSDENGVTTPSVISPAAVLEAFQSQSKLSSSRSLSTVFQQFSLNHTTNRTQELGKNGHDCGIKQEKVLDSEKSSDHDEKFRAFFGSGAVRESAASLTPKMVSLVIIEAVLLRLCERAIELSSKHLVHLTAMLPSMLHGVLSQWKENFQKGHFVIKSKGVEHDENDVSGENITSTSSRLLTKQIFDSYRAPVFTSLPFSSLLNLLKGSFPIFLSSPVRFFSLPAFSCCFAKYFQAAASHHCRVGELLNHTVLWCCYVNRQSLRRVQNVHCLHALILANLLSPPRHRCFRDVGEQACGRRCVDSANISQETQRGYQTSDSSNGQHLHSHVHRKSDKEMIRYEMQKVENEGQVLGILTSVTTSKSGAPAAFPFVGLDTSAEEARLAVSHSLSHLLMRYITSKEVDNLCETASSKDITYLPQFALTHCWCALFPEVRSAALLWVQKQKMKNKDTTSSFSSTSERVSSPTVSAIRGSSFVSPLPSFLNSVRPSKPPREIFSRLTRMTQDSHHFSFAAWDNAYLNFLQVRTLPLVHPASWKISSEGDDNGKIDHKNNSGIAHHHLGNGASGNDENGGHAIVQTDVAVSNGISAGPEENVAPYPMLSHSFSIAVGDVTDDHILRALHHLSMARGDQFLRHLSLLHEQLLPYHPSPSTFAQIVRDHHPTLSGVLVHHIIYREWPRIVSSTRMISSNFDSGEESGTPEAMTPFLTASMPSGCHEHSAAASTIQSSVISIPKHFSACRQMLSALWMLLRRVNILEVSRAILWMLPALSKSGDDATKSRSSINLHSQKDMEQLSLSCELGTGGNAGPQSSFSEKNRNRYHFHFILSKEVGAVIRCVVAHIPPSLVHIVFQQVAEMREIAALPLHPYVLHFLLVLVKTLHECKMRKSSAPLHLSNGMPTTGRPAGNPLFSDIHKAFHDGSTPPMYSVSEEEDTVTARKVAHSEEHRNEAKVKVSPSLRNNSCFSQQFEGIVSEVRKLLQKFAVESLAHNLYYHEKAFAAQGGIRDTKKKNFCEHLNNKDEEDWWETSQYYALWQELEEAVNFSSSPASFHFLNYVNEKDWSIPDGENENMDHKDIASNNWRHENHAFSLDYIDDRKMRRTNSSMTASSSALSSFRVTSGCANPSNEQVVKEVLPLLDSETKMNELLQSSSSSLPQQGKAEKKLQHYWSKLFVVMACPEAEVRLCTIMATMQQKILLVSDRKEREKIWALGHGYELW